MAQNPYQPYSPYQQAQYMPYQGTYTYPTQPMQEQMPVYGYRTQNTGIQKPSAMSGRVVSQEAEEWVCNFLADYGTMVFDAAYSVLGDDAVSVVPREYERMVA